MNTAAIETRVRETLLAASPPPRCAWLFGSRARDEARPTSDVDVAVLLGFRPEPSLSGPAQDLCWALEGALGLPVDVVVLDGADTDLVHRVMRDGRLLYDLDPSLRVAFEVRARNAYWDLLPIRREYRRTGRGAS